jgi:hypothetical protein
VLRWQPGLDIKAQPCSTRTAFSMPRTLLGKNSASHAAKRFWRRSAIFPRLFSQTSFSRTTGYSGHYFARVQEDDITLLALDFR